MKHRQKNERKLEDDRRVDEALEETFPASDAPSYNRGIDSRDTGFTRPDELKWTSMGGGKAMREDEGKKTSSFVYLIGGFAVGAVCGLLFAPKKGSELRTQLAESARRARESAREAYQEAAEKVGRAATRTASEVERTFRGQQP